MPTYVFHCQDCGLFEETMSMKHATEIIDCPFCTKDAVRLYTRPGLITSSGALRQRIEQSAIPKVVRREHSTTHSCRHSYPSHFPTGVPAPAPAKRPWQISH
ncbi:zinc ribbon domain-containing protein [Brevibacillus laterosporus]|uniref:FmdB family zinc ribbon protein n=1 Tax=Brevibacillus laterosporus TaxID=1465 RepID=UPI00215D1302|nr:zinc ribbon domain-containing protein [Brevibacillus laterosporus]MCR8995965.1 zinc ribbon domain-containing protein [Brevibacillus laterosporus]